MTSLFFLANNSLKTTYGNCGMNNGEFLAEVRRLVTEHGFNARVFSAIACDSCKKDEQYGAVVELTFAYPQQLLDVAQTFKWALRQDRILLFARGEVYPSGFKMSKLAQCTFPAGSTLRHAALNLHNEQRMYLKQNGINTDAVVYDDGTDVCLLAVCNTEEHPNFDYWQKCLGAFFRTQNIVPAFYFARVLNY